MPFKPTEEISHELVRIGNRIRAGRLTLKLPIRVLAPKAGISISEWNQIEAGKYKVKYSILETLVELIGLRVEDIFNTREDDFFPFVRMAMGADPAELTAEEIDEAYSFFVEVMNFSGETAQGGTS
ncbi:MAG: helix-turn-helix transcriptional regulator [Phycisphaerae bacterium]